MGFVYALYCPITDVPKYIGKTINPLRKRLNDHLKNSTQINKRTNWIKSLKAKGLVPKIEELDRCDDEKYLGILEQHYIWLFRSWGFELKNSTFGGDGGVKIIPYIPTEETRKKMSESSKKNTESRNKKNRENGCFQRASERMKTDVNPGKKQKTPILQYSISGDFIREWECSEYAMKELKLSDGGISKCLSGKHKSSCGYIWRYKTDNFSKKIDVNFCRGHKSGGVVLQINRITGEVKEWKSKTEAAKFLKIDYKSLDLHMNNSRKNKIYKSVEKKLLLDEYDWKYKKYN